MGNECKTTGSGHQMNVDEARRGIVTYDPA